MKDMRIPPGLIILAIALFLLVPFSATAQVVAVDWGGKYLPSPITSTALNTGALQVSDTPLTGNSVRRNWIYSESVHLNPSPANYVPPIGRSGTFYGALQNVDSRGAYNYSRARIDGDATSDTLYLWGSEPGTGATTKITGLIYFKKEDFLTGSPQSTFALASANAFTMKGSMAGDSRRLRFAILNDDTWYVSNTSFGSGTSWSLDDAASDLWAVWDPTGNDLANILNNPSLEFTISGSTFQNIQAVGFAYEIQRATNSPRLTLENFKVELVAVPEASPVATLSLAALALLGYRSLCRNSETRAGRSKE